MNHDADAIPPFTPNNQRLEQYIHPKNWVNPTTNGKYNIVVIGAGTSGLVAAWAAAVSAPKLHWSNAATIRSAGSKDIDFDPLAIEINFSRVIERMRWLRADISPHDSAERFKSLGIDVFLGIGKFTGRDTV